MKRGYRKPNIRMQSYLDTLLHEMLHAVFLILTCWCQFGCARVHASHGFQWQAAALALEEADDSGNGLLRLGCDLDRSVCMKRSVGLIFQTIRS
jgi:hypothetical protein